jgi:hypothetical protein
MMTTAAVESPPAEAAEARVLAVHQAAVAPAVAAVSTRAVAVRQGAVARAAAEAWQVVAVRALVVMPAWAASAGDDGGAGAVGGSGGAPAPADPRCGLAAR